MPEIIAHALYRSTPYVEPFSEEIPTPPLDDLGFGIAAKVKPFPNPTEEEIDFATPVVKILAKPADTAPVFEPTIFDLNRLPANTLGKIREKGYVTEPLVFLETEVDPDDAKVNRDLRTIKKNSAEGIWRDVLAKATPPAETEERTGNAFAIHRTLPPTPAAPLEKRELTYKFRQSHGEMWKEGFNSDAVVVSSYILSDEEEILKAMQDPSFEKRDEPEGENE